MTTGDENVRREPPGTPAFTEEDRLRAEVADLRGRLDTRARRHRRWLAARRVIAAVLVALAGFGIVLSTIGVWAARTTLDTDRWVATVGPLPQQPKVTAAMAQYLTNEVFAQLNVQKRLTDALPPRASFLAGPATDSVKNYVHGTVLRVLRSEQFHALWVDANRLAHERATAVLENKSATVKVQGSTVTLNLLPVVNNVIVQINQRLPTLFGKKIDLPPVKSGQVPPNLQQRVESTLGVRLPRDFAQITFYNRHKLEQLQKAVLVFKRFVILLVIGTVLSLALGLLASTNRRRTVLQFGLWLTVAVVVLVNVLRAVRSQLLDQVPAGVYRDGASAAFYEIFTRLREWGYAFLGIGIALAVVAYLAGPGRLPVYLRRVTVRGAEKTAEATRTVATGTALREWCARHVDPLRIGGIAVAALVALLFTSWTALIVVAVLLAGYEVLVTLLARRGAPGGPSAA